MEILEYVVVIKDIRLGVDYYLNSNDSYSTTYLTTDLNKASRFSCEELAVNMYKLLRNRIPKAYSAEVCAVEEGALVLKKTLCKYMLLKNVY